MGHAATLPLVYLLQESELAVLLAVLGTWGHGHGLGALYALAQWVLAVLGTWGHGHGLGALYALAQWVHTLPEGHHRTLATSERAKAGVEDP